MKLETNPKLTRLYIVRKAIFDVLDLTGYDRYLLPINMEKARFPNVEYGLVPASERELQETGDFSWTDPFVVYGHYRFAATDPDAAQDQGDLMAHNIEQAFSAREYPNTIDSDPAVDSPRFLMTIDDILLTEYVGNMIVAKGIAAVAFKGEVRSQIEWKSTL